MSDCGWTPGPWVIGDENNSSVEVCIGDVLASIDREDPHFNEMKITRDEMRANAHLISAAPELYEKLYMLNSYLVEDDPYYTESQEFNEVERLMAKARGEE